jgi:nitrate reductase gamma subunit
MKGLQVLIGGLLPYIALVAFVGGMVHRFRIWFKTPQPGKMTLFPIKAETTAKAVLAEVLLFPSLFRGDRVLWAFSWVFHVTLALVLVGHVRVFTGIADQVLRALGMSAGGIDTMSSVTGGAAGIVLLATGTLLLVRRFTVPRVREISAPEDFAALLLLIAIIVTGNAMRFGSHFDLEQTRTWAISLLLFSPAVPADGAFLLHALLAQLLFIYIPFSKILHFGGIFFTQALVRGR